MNPNAANERMKLTVTILDQDLRATTDALLRVAASRQVSQAASGSMPRYRRPPCRSLRKLIHQGALTCVADRSRRAERPGSRNFRQPPDQ